MKVHKDHAWYKRSIIYLHKIEKKEYIRSQVLDHRKHSYLENPPPQKKRVFTLRDRFHVIRGLVRRSRDVEWRSCQHDTDKQSWSNGQQIHVSHTQLLYVQKVT